MPNAKQKPDTMFLTESYLIGKDDPRWRELDRMAWLAKNIYNCATYLLRQAFFEDRKTDVHHDPQQRTWIRLLNFTFLKEQLRHIYPDDYAAMPKRVTETCIMSVISNWKGFASAHDDWEQHPHKYLGEPNLPRYKHTGDEGRAECLWNHEAILKRPYQKCGEIALSGCAVTFLPGKHIYEQIQRIENLTKEDTIDLLERIAVVKCQPRPDGYQITITYQVQIASQEVETTYLAGIDLGINNLMAITSNKAGFKPILVNGRPLKSLNQYFNKCRAKLQSQLPKGQFISQRLIRLHQRRSRRIKDYLHRVSKKVIALLVAEGVNVLVIGKNDGWKQRVNMGKRTNQTFMSIPHSQLIDMLTYKAKLASIQVIVIEESYTSKCSFLDGEPVGKHESYAGQRVKRGLFRAGNGRFINADVNASYNIIRKAVPDAFVVDGIEDTPAVYPLLALPA